MVISPGYQVSDFSGNSRAQKLNRAKTKQESIAGIQYFSRYQLGVVSSTLTFIIYHLSSFYPPHNFSPNFPFCPCHHHRHQQSTTPPWIRLAYDFLQPRLVPTSNKVNLSIMIPLAASNLYAQLPRFHRRNRCLQLPIIDIICDILSPPSLVRPPYSSQTGEFCRKIQLEHR